MVMQINGNAKKMVKQSNAKGKQWWCCIGNDTNAGFKQW